MFAKKNKKTTKTAIVELSDGNLRRMDVPVALNKGDDHYLPVQGEDNRFEKVTILSFPDGDRDGSSGFGGFSGFFKWWFKWSAIIVGGFIVLVIISNIIAAIFMGIR